MVKIGAVYVLLTTHSSVSSVQTRGAKSGGWIYWCELLSAAVSFLIPLGVVQARSFQILLIWALMINQMTLMLELK